MRYMLTIQSKDDAKESYRFMFNTALPIPAEAEGKVIKETILNMYFGGKGIDNIISIMSDIKEKALGISKKAKGTIAEEEINELYSETIRDVDGIIDVTKRIFHTLEQIDEKKIYSVTISEMAEPEEALKSR